MQCVKYFLLVSISLGVAALEKENFSVITLVSKDNQEFTVPFSSARQSRQIKALLNQPAITHESNHITFNDIKGSTLAVVAEIMHNMQKYPVLKGKKLVEALVKEQTVHDWPVNLLHANDFLDFPIGLAFTTQIIAADKGLLEALNTYWIPQDHVNKSALNAFKHYYFLLTKKKFFHCPKNVPLETYAPAYQCQKESVSLQEYLEYQPEKIIDHLKTRCEPQHGDLQNFGLNSIKELAALAAIDTLTELNISHNFIRKIKSQTFKPLTNLRRLVLEKNCIEILEDEAFEGLKNLEWLILRSNNVTSINKEVLQPLSTLKFFNLSDNNINTIHPESFKNLTNLKTLTLRNNALTALPSNLFAHQDKIEWIDLSVNKLKNLDPTLLSSTPCLEQLLLHDNNLTTITAHQFSNLRRLRLLNLGNNQLATIDQHGFYGLTALNTLNLAKNVLQDSTAGHWQGLTNMTSLDLSYNTIRSVTVGMLPTLASLYYLNLSHNPLSLFDTFVIHKLPGLKKLILIGCQLTTLNKNVLKDLYDRPLLFLANNPLSEQEKKELQETCNVTYSTDTQ